MPAIEERLLEVQYTSKEVQYSWLRSGLPVKFNHTLFALERLYPREALCGGITVSFLEPLCRSWSHFVGIYRPKLTRSVES